MLKMVDGTGIIGLDMVCPLCGAVSPPQPPNYDKVEVEGVGSLMLPNSLEAPVERVELIGNSVQPTTTGKNLFDIKKASDVSNYITTETLAKIDITAAIVFDVKKNTNYCLSVSGKTDQPSINFNIANDVQRKSIFNKLKTEETLNSLDSGKIYVGFSGGDTELNATKLSQEYFDIQLEEASSKTPYEPHTGGKPSPSPEYPQEIKNVGKWNEETQKYEVDAKVTGKNLLNLQKASEKVNWTQHSNFPGYYNFPVFVGRGNTVTISIPQKIPTGQGLFLSVCLTESGAREGWIAHNSNDSLNNTKLTYKATNDYIYLNAHSDTIAGMKKYFGNLQVEYGNVATPYQPYKEQTLTLTSDRPITKWDRLVEQGGQIGWLYKSRIAEIPKTGYALKNTNENRYGVYFSKSSIFKDAVVTKGSPEKDSNIFTHFKPGNPYASNGNIAWLYVAGGNTDLRIKVEDETINTVELFEQYISDKDIQILYETESTEFVPLPQSEQNAIRALKTYYPTTVITADGGELDPDIKVTYRKEI